MECVIDPADVMSMMNIGSGSPAVMISNKSATLLSLSSVFFFFLSVLILLSGCLHLFLLSISSVSVPILLPSTLSLCFSEEEAVCQSLSRDVVY